LNSRDHTLLLTDGYHRVAAAQQVGRTVVQADICVGTKPQAVQSAIDVARAEWGVSADQAREAMRRYGGGQSNDAARTVDRAHQSSASPCARTEPCRRARLVQPAREHPGASGAYLLVDRAHVSITFSSTSGRRVSVWRVDAEHVFASWSGTSFLGRRGGGTY